jgi:hypothetical protein
MSLGSGQKYRKTTVVWEDRFPSPSTGGAGSTRSINEEGFGEGTPLVNHVVGDLLEFDGRGHHGDVSRVAPFHEQTSSRHLRSTRHDQQTAQTVATGVPGCEFDLSGSPSGFRREAHHRYTPYLRAGGGVGVSLRE